MLWHMFWVILSFFAVIGILECILGVVEMFSLNRVHSVRQATFRVELEGDEAHVEYLLNTLSLMAEKVDVGQRETALEIVDCGLAEETRREIEAYCEKNPWVLFTDPAGDDIIT